VKLGLARFLVRVPGLAPKHFAKSTPLNRRSLVLSTILLTMSIVIALTTSVISTAWSTLSVDTGINCVSPLRKRVCIGYWLQLFVSRMSKKLFFDNILKFLYTKCFNYYHLITAVDIASLNNYYHVINRTCDHSKTETNS
jgi:hypothetical protein